MCDFWGSFVKKSVRPKQSFPVDVIVVGVPKSDLPPPKIKPNQPTYSKDQKKKIAKEYWKKKFSHGSKMPDWLDHIIDKVTEVFELFHILELFTEWVGGPLIGGVQKLWLFGNSRGINYI